MKNKKVLIAVAVLVLGGLFWLSAKVYKSQETERLGFLAEKNFEAFVRPYAMKMGNPEAKVYLVEFLDPECESCREFYPHVKDIMNEFEGKVQLVVRYATFHQNSVFVIKILEAARKQNKYWETMSVLFETQPLWGSHHNPQPELIWQYLPNIGLDIEKIRADLEDPETMKIIEQDKIDLTELGVRGTPTFFVNGKSPEQFGPEALREAVKKEIEKI